MRSVLLALLVLSAVAVTPASSAAPPPWIQPGERVSSSVGLCTLNFVFDGPGAVYIGTAAHCVSGVGSTVSVTGIGVIGTVVWHGDADWIVTDGPGVEVDFALIQVSNALTGLVRADVKGPAGVPTGYTTYTGTLSGDPLLVSGYGLGFEFTSVTREFRGGALFGDDPRGYTAYLPIIFGDSGGPVVHALSGKALGTVSGIAVACCGAITESGAFNYGPTVEGILADLAADGFAVTVRTTGP